MNKMNDLIIYVNCYLVKKNINCYSIVHDMNQSTVYFLDLIHHI